MIKGKALVKDVDDCKLKEGQCAFWWMGQHSFIAKMGRHILYIDPYLKPSERRNVEPMVEVADFAHATAVLGTHDHSDHIDRTVWPDIANTVPHVPFIVPEILIEILSKDLSVPQNRFIGVNDGQTVVYEGLKITGVAAAHEFLDRDEETGRYPYLGFVIEGNGCKLYHAGDTIKYEGLETRMVELAPDVALLPINGRDAERLARKCYGNMTYQEAVDLAGALAPKLTVPTHWDMFDNNREDPQLMIDYAKVKFPALEIKIPGYGERVVVDCSG